jgi:tetratricopeptide (TPR) repeat protein
VGGGRRCASARRPAAWLLIAGACCLISSSLKAAAPWSFGADAERKQAESRWSGRSFHELYALAQERMEGRQLNLAEAADLLRLAISVDSKSGQKLTAQKVPFSYFPYYYLARALDLLGDPEKAQRCLDEEDRQGKISGAEERVRRAFADLKETVKVRGEVVPLQGLGDEIAGWPDDERILLSPKGREATAEIKRLTDLIRKSQPAELKTNAAGLRTKLSGYLSEELKYLEQSRGSLLAEPWVGAFAPGDPIRTQPCKAAGGEEGSLAWLKGARTTLGECRSRVEKGMRAAGAWSCDDVRKQTEQVRSLATIVASLPGGAGRAGDDSVEALQGSSCIAWDKATARQVADALPKLKTDRDRVVQKLDERSATFKGQIKNLKSALVAVVSGERDRIPVVTAQCARDLQLGGLEGELQALRDKLNPSRVPDVPDASSDLVRAKDLVNRQLKAFEERVTSRIQGMTSPEGRCPGLVSASLDALPASGNALKGGWRQSDLDSLCAKLGQAQRETVDCWKGQGEAFRTAVNRYSSLLQEMASGGEQTSDGGCLAPALNDLRRVGARSGSIDQVWMDQALAAKGAAQACLKDRQTASAESFVKVQRGVGRLADRLAKVESIKETSTEIGALKRDLVRTRDEVRTADDRLRKAVPLYETGDGGVLDDAALRKILGETGLEGRVRASAWQLLAESRDAELHPLVWRAVRDLALDPEVARAGQRTAQWDLVSGRVAPFLALNEAYDLFAKGQLDEAITTLREASLASEIPQGGKEAALVHASLSYFLFAKKTVLEGGSGSGEVVRALDQDLTAEARKAREADSGIQRLPEKLFRSEEFRQYFAALR